jgi:hypothetical protein
LPIDQAAADAELADVVAGVFGPGSINATSEATTINVRVPNLRVWTRPAPISSYIFVRPRPVAAHASGIVQLMRSRNGMAEVIEWPCYHRFERDCARANGCSRPRIALPVQREKKQKN